MVKKIGTSLFLGIFLVTFFSCSSVRTMRNAMDTAMQQGTDSAARATGKAVGDSVGNQIGEQLGQSIVRSFTPQLMTLYASMLFGYAFNAGSYWIHEDYKEGQWTEWRVTTPTEQSPSTMEKAFLKRTEDGHEWWQVKWTDPEQGTIILEGLFAPEQAQLLRLRAQFPGQDAGEIPVQQGTPVYTTPMRLTEESLEGATVGTETVTVGAGTFTTRHVRYSELAGGSTDWYLSDQVPGGLVKYHVVASRSGDSGGEASAEGLESDQYTVELVRFGTDAKSALNSF